MRRGRTKTFRALEEQERAVNERKRKNHRGRVQKNARTSEFQDGGRKVINPELRETQE